MRFLKYFEAKEDPYELLEEYKEDIIKVISKYYNTHHGDICEEIDEIIWSSSEDASERLEEFGADEQCIRLLIDDLLTAVQINNRMRNPSKISNLLEIYYDCIELIGLVTDDILGNVKEIFYDYSDQGECEILKNSKFNDDRFEVYIKMKDIFLKINFEEVFGRIRELGFENYSVDGSREGSLEKMVISFWKPISKELKDKLSGNH